MTDNNLQQTLREDGLAGEPPFETRFEEILASGRRAVVRKRLKNAGRGFAIAAVAATAGVVSVGSSGPGGSPAAAAVPPAAQAVLDDFDPKTFPAIVDGEIRDVIGSALPEGHIEPRKDIGIRLQPTDYGYSDSWVADYQLPNGNQLSVWLRTDQSAAEGDKQRQCEEDLAEGTVEACSVETLDNGRTSVTRIFRDRDSFSRQVADYRGYGYLVIARETVEAADLAAAEAAWTIDTEALGQIATSDRLVFAEATGPTDCANPAYIIEEDDPEAYATVRCDDVDDDEAGTSSTEAR